MVKTSKSVGILWVGISLFDILLPTLEDSNNVFHPTTTFVSDQPELFQSKTMRKFLYLHNFSYIQFKLYITEWKFQKILIFLLYIFLSKRKENIYFRIFLSQNYFRITRTYLSSHIFFNQNLLRISKTYFYSHIVLNQNVLRILAVF